MRRKAQTFDAAAAIGGEIIVNFRHATNRKLEWSDDRREKRQRQAQNINKNSRSVKQNEKKNSQIYVAESLNFPMSSEGSTATVVTLKLSFKFELYAKG